MPNNFYKRYGKRALDLVIAVTGFLLLSPFLLLIALLIKLTDHGPVFFIQRRVGREFNPITVYKFRSMKAGADREGIKITGRNDTRITRTGKLLRALKLDELPQLLNVIAGDMSIVGPRPEVEEFVTLFKEDYKHILSVRPGITDYASIEYRDEESVLAGYEDIRSGYIKEVLPAKIILYKKYIEELSLLTDLKLIFLTVRKIFT
jgi:lipopolysaccharide/colanic/teichoic acid biosynthesis glycosyltransferase